VEVLDAEYSVAVRLEVIVGAREADNQLKEWSRCFAVVRVGCTWRRRDRRVRPAIRLGIRMSLQASIETDLIRLPSRLDLSPKQAKAGSNFMRRSRACISRSCKHVKQTISNDG
jgi:hypothetical protein